MKKLVAILLTLAMLLGVCAMAEGRQLIMKDVVIAANGAVVMDLTGLEAVIDVAAEDGAAGLRLSINGNGNPLGTLAMAVLNEKEALLQVNANGYGVDLTSVQVDMSQVEEMVQQAMANMNSEKIGSVLENYDEIVTDGGVTTLDGVDYQTTLISISEEQMAELVTELPNFTPNANLDNLHASVNGAFYDGEASDIVELAIAFQIDEAAANITVHADHIVGGGENGGNLLMLDIAVEAEDQSFGATATFEAVSGVDGAWLPKELGGAPLLTVDDFSDAEGPVVADIISAGQMMVIGAMGIIAGNAAA